MLKVNVDSLSRYVTALGDDPCSTLLLPHPLSLDPKINWSPYFMLRIQRTVTVTLLR